MTEVRPPAGRPPHPPAVWGDVPQRNKYFAGREDVLAELHSRLAESVSGPPHALHGMGGVGKTQLAVEYCYRHLGDYDLVWWVPADAVPFIRRSLTALAPRLGIASLLPGSGDDPVPTVLDALRRGEPSRRWLLVYDNADQPEQLWHLLPDGPGHVLVTSRNYRWRNRADAVEIEVFRRSESLEFLARRVGGLPAETASALAEQLGDLPVALEHAGALQVESGLSVAEYLDLFANESARVFAEDPPADYAAGIAGVWRLAAARLAQDTPVAWELLRRMAFFGPDPIPRELLTRGRLVFGAPLQDELGDPILVGRTVRELGRYGLARIDNHSRTLQVHRLVQKLIREDIDADEGHILQHEVHLMLATADPAGPDDVTHWPRYAELLAHAEASEAVHCAHPDVRRLVRHLVRYLFCAGDLACSDTVSAAAFARWVEDSGPDDTDVLALAGLRATVLWAQGRYRQADELRRDTLRRMRRVLGEDHEETLLVASAHSADLRARGDFVAALKLDSSTLAQHTRLFGGTHPQTFLAASHLAVDQVLNGNYSAAHDTDHTIYEDRLSLLGRNDHPWVVHSLGAIARDLRQGGKYREALLMADRAYAGFLELVHQRVLPLSHPWVLAQGRDLSVARRTMSHLGAALELAEEVHERSLQAFDRRHPDALAAGMNLGNACRALGDTAGDEQLLARADALLQAAFALYGEVYGEEHPFTHGCALNLAILRRRLGDEHGARRVLETAFAGLETRLGGTHHYTLVGLTALASSLAAIGDVLAARRRGQRALDGLRRVLGETHPHTLACASNLALDMHALGETAASHHLAADTIRHYATILPDDHLDVRTARQRRRIAIDFEPPPL